MLYLVYTLYVATACGGLLEGPTGVFESPGYPSTQGYRRYCSWEIVVPVGRRVKIELLDFDLQTAMEAYKHRLIVSSVSWCSPCLIYCRQFHTLLIFFVYIGTFSSRSQFTESFLVISLLCLRDK